LSRLINREKTGRKPGINREKRGKNPGKPERNREKLSNRGIKIIQAKPRINLEKPRRDYSPILV
jgi:hypothetical protein